MVSRILDLGFILPLVGWLDFLDDDLIAERLRNFVYHEKWSPFRMIIMTRKRSTFSSPRTDMIIVRLYYHDGRELHGLIQMAASLLPSRPHFCVFLALVFDRNCRSVGSHVKPLPELTSSQRGEDSQAEFAIAIAKRQT